MLNFVLAQRRSTTIKKLARLIFPILAVLLLAPLLVAHNYTCTSDLVGQDPAWTEVTELSAMPSQQMLGAAIGSVNALGDVFCINVGRVAEQAKRCEISIPDDTYLDKQWAIDRINAHQAWQIASGNSDTLIAILDTGIDQTHTDLAGKVVANVNFTQSPTVDDVYGHGTHVAGIIGAIADNGIGIAGLAYSCSLMNVKVADDMGFCDATAVAEAIVWAVDNGAKVINVSLTFDRPTQALEDAVNYAWEKGAVVVAGLGNYTGGRPVYPACYPKCMGVAATNANDCIVFGSGYSDWVDVAAPGTDICSTLRGNKYGVRSGTSMATAYVAGLAGLLVTLVSDTNGNGISNDEVCDTIRNSCDEIGIPGAGKGRINALKAVRKAVVPN